MFILVVIGRENLREYWEDVLGRFKNNYTIILKEEIRGFIESNRTTHLTLAIVIDRVIVDINLFNNGIGIMDFFVVLNSWDERSCFTSLQKDINIKFYEFPVLPEIIVDDIKSITKIRDYLVIEKITLGDICINRNSHTVNNQIKSVYLRKKEFDLLCFLAQNKGKVISRSTILDEVWDMNAKVVTNTVDVHVSKIRKILKDEFGVSSLIKTIPCCGYLLVEVYGE